MLHEARPRFFVSRLPPRSTSNPRQHKSLERSKQHMEQPASLIEILPIGGARDTGGRRAGARPVRPVEPGVVTRLSSRRRYIVEREASATPENDKGA